VHDVMKNVTKILVMLILVLVHIGLDQRLYFYGEGYLNLGSSLPLNIKPEHRNDFEGGFILWDQHYMSLVGKGVKYSNSRKKIDEIVKYGFSDEKLIVLVRDIGDDCYYVEISKNKNPYTRQEFSIIINREEAVSNLDDYQWIEIRGNEKNVVRMVRIRSYSMIVLILLVLWVSIKKIL